MGILTKAAVSALMACTVAGGALAQESEFLASEWEYGPRDVIEGEVPVWNTAKQKITAGEDLVGVTIDATDPRTYCAAANAGYDFTWVEMQHQATSWESVARMFAACPDAEAVHGIRLAYTDEREAQHALDSGAMVIVYPTIDSADEAREAVSWVKFPPVGRHSQGGGQRWGMYEDVEGGYRATLNDNIVVIAMIETMEGVEEVYDIAEVEGLDALMIASGDLGNFSGYAEGTPEYESIVDRVFDAATSNGLQVCGPLRWRAEREGFTCFQAGNEMSLIRRGAEAEAEATARPE